MSYFKRKESTFGAFPNVGVVHISNWVWETLPPESMQETPRNAVVFCRSPQYPRHGARTRLLHAFALLRSKPSSKMTLNVRFCVEMYTAVGVIATYTAYGHYSKWSTSCLRYIISLNELRTWGGGRLRCDLGSPGVNELPGKCRGADSEEHPG